MEKWIHAAMPEMRRLYDYYGTDVFSWLASLYDRDSGMFYYADSARDNEGFLPDVESTAQALNLLSGIGAINHLGRVWKNALSEGISRSNVTVRSRKSNVKRCAGRAGSSCKRIWLFTNRNPPFPSERSAQRRVSVSLRDTGMSEGITGSMGASISPKECRKR